MNNDALFDLDAERHALGSMMQSPEALLKGIRILGELTGVFHKLSHKVIYEAVLSLWSKKIPVDIFSLTRELGVVRDGHLSGGVVYAYEIQESVPTAANVEYYAGVVVECAARRRLAQAAGHILNASRNASQSLAEIFEVAGMELSESAKVAERSKTEWASDLFPDALSEVEAIQAEGRGIRGISTGFSQLDARINGLCPGRLHVVGGRPAEGKSTFAQTIAWHVAAVERRPVIFFSLEMPPKEIARRMISARARVDGMELDAGRVGADGWTRIAKETGRLSEIPFGISEARTRGEIRAEYAEAKARYGEAPVAFVDYVQLMSLEKGEDRFEGVGNNSLALKQLAMENYAPVVALSQFNRESVKRGDTRPKLIDFRESGNIEQDADVACGLWRPSSVQGDEIDPDFEAMHCYVLKARGGKPGKVDLDWYPKHLLFKDAGSGEF